MNVIKGERMMEGIRNGINVDALSETMEQMRQRGELGESHFRVKNRWVGGGFNCSAVQGFYAAGQEDGSRSEPFRLDADEPPVLLGENRGPNPVEYLLTALAGCLTSSIVYHAAARGIRIEELESEVEGDLDLRGFMGIADGVRPGYQQIRVTFKVTSDAPAEELQKLALYSPVLDTIMSETPVRVTVQQRDRGASMGRANGRADGAGGGKADRLGSDALGEA